MDKETLRLYHQREMGMSDYTTAINTAMEKGEAKDIRNLLGFSMIPRQVSVVFMLLSMVANIQEGTYNNGD
ncbi:hypothetical protein FACS1894200_00450 [Spirochaetia bacterium]|nr:hypothetical protein FACS1894200_00450 [Spirochaetia bacterium]